MSDPNTDRPAATPAPTPPFVEPAGVHANRESSTANPATSGSDSVVDDAAEAEQREANRQNEQRLAEKQVQVSQVEADRVEADRAETDRAEADRTPRPPVDSPVRPVPLAVPLAAPAATVQTPAMPETTPETIPETTPGTAATLPPAQNTPREQRVFVRPPLEPKRRGNRGIGSAIAISSVLVFATVFAIIGALIILIGAPDQDLGTVVGRFIGSPTFFVPALFFVVGFVLLVLLLNRANWWTYIVGSLFVAALVYFGTIGVRLLADNIVTMTPDDAANRFAAYAANPFVIASAFAAREVAMWFGAIIAARGRRVKAANVTAREQHALASEQYRAEFERGYTPGV